MPLSGNVVGQTYNQSQVSLGLTSTGSNSYDYTELAESPLSATATINGYDPSTNEVTFTVSTVLGSFAGSGTVVGNDSDSFLINTAISIPLLGFNLGAIYVTNTPGEQPGFLRDVSVPFESAGIVYNPACYSRGTLILTDRGEISVEALVVGDLIVTTSGEHRPIRWIGCRSYAGRFLAANPGMQPIRFSAGSLGDGLPHDDLLVSPNHSMFLDGMLVPARCLVNGTTIVQVRGLPRVDYYHIELDSHDIILAEGAPSESFVDDDSRGMFHNAGEWERLYPGRARVAAAFCAPRVESGPEMEAIRRRLDEVAGQVAQAA